MALPDPSIAPTEARTAEAVARSHGELLADKSLQFDRTGFTPPEVPGWLLWIRDALRALAPLLEVIFWVGLALIVAALAYYLIRELLRLRLPKPRADVAGEAAVAEWRPDETTARNLLSEADSLAADGRFAEAAHLLLMRSVEDIARHHPRAIKASFTTREIAGVNALPEAARPPFTRIGEVVERSLFGGRPVDATDFAACRRAYEDFALPTGWRA